MLPERDRGIPGLSFQGPGTVAPHLVDHIACRCHIPWRRAGHENADTGHLPVTTVQEALSLFAWVFVVTYLILQIRLQLRILGSFVSPLAVVFMVSSSLLPSHIMIKSEFFKSGWVIVHVASLFLANALFALAFSLGVMYLLQERHIKRKNFGFLYERLPSLERLDSIAHYCLMSGFPLMTAGLITGFAYAAVVWHSPWNWDPKEILSLVTWIIYAVLVHERLAVGWRGRRAAWLSILGFSATLLPLSWRAFC